MVVKHKKNGVENKNDLAIVFFLEIARNSEILGFPRGNRNF